MRFLLAFILCVHSLHAEVAEKDRELATQLSTFKHIVLDVRNSRGGNGDIAAAYLLALEFVERFDYHRTISVLVDPHEETRWMAMQGNNPKLRALIDILKVSDAKWFRPADLYITMADNGEGHKIRRDTIARKRHAHDNNPDDLFQSARFLVDDKSVLVMQRVFGATESTEDFGHLEIGEHKYEIASPGLSEERSGIYYDAVAQKFSDKTVRASITETLDHYLLQHGVGIDASKHMIEKVLMAAKADRIKYGFAYGVSHADVKDQWADYLTAMAKTPRINKPVIILSPSSVGQADVEVYVKGPLAKDIVIRRASEFGDNAFEDFLKGKGPRVLVLELPKIPHPLFTALLASSQLPALVSGDASMSAAIQIGRPFAITQISWNVANVEEFREQLENYERSSTFEAVFEEEDPDLTKVRGLQKHKAAFQNVADFSTYTTDRIINGAYYARELELHPAKIHSIIPKISDYVMRRTIQAAKNAKLPRKPSCVVPFKNMIEGGSYAKKLPHEHRN